MRIHGSDFSFLIRGSNVGGIFLRRPGRTRIIHPFEIFWPKGCGRDKRITDQFIAVLETDAFPIKINNPGRGFFKQVIITEVPVSWNEENRLNRWGAPKFVKKREKEAVNEKFLVRDHVFVTPGRGERGEKISAKDDQVC
jgi:hypothetical protein